MKTRVLAALTVLILSATAQAATITATVDRYEVTLQRDIILTVTIEGNKVTKYELPPLDDFYVSRQGTSRQTKIVNGSISQSIARRYALTPRKYGEFTIPSIKATVDGQERSTSPIKVKAVPQEMMSRQPFENKREMFAMAGVNHAKVYMGQQVLYQLKFFRSSYGRAEVDFPNFDGFRSEQLGQENNDEVVDGTRYSVYELRQALFPDRTGILQIGPASIKAEQSVGTMTFFTNRTRTVNVTAPGVRVEVLPLPPPPPNYSGLVGQFSLLAQLSKQRLKAGESTTLTLTVRGVGNANSITEPAVGDIKGFKVYDDKPDNNVQATFEGMRGSKTFRKSLVPLEAGKLVIPSIELVYFNPAKGVYESSRSEPFRLLVAPGEVPEDLRLTELVAPSTGQVSVKVLADDILPNHVGVHVLAPGGFTRGFGSSLAAASLAPPFLFFLLGWYRRRAVEEATNVDLRRRRDALRKAVQGMKNVNQDDASSLASETSRVVRIYLGDKLAVEGLALTAENAATLLEGREVSGPLVGETKELLATCEAAQYGAGDLTPERAAGVRLLLQRLDKELR